eukprot:scaffold287139_cov21-Tisochrysis_lutea.AAC.1
MGKPWKLDDTGQNLGLPTSSPWPALKTGRTLRSAWMLWWVRAQAVVTLHRIDMPPSELCCTIGWLMGVAMPTMSLMMTPLRDICNVVHVYHAKGINGLVTYYPMQGHLATLYHMDWGESGVLRITVSKSGGAQLLQLTRNFGCPELSCLCINRVEVRKGCHRGASTQPIHVSQIRHVGSCHPSKPFVKCIELLCLHLLKILLLVLVVLQGVSRHAPSSHPQLIISSILGRMQHLKCMSARLGILLPHPHVKAQPDALSILCCPTFPTPEIIPGRHV